MARSAVAWWPGGLTSAAARAVTPSRTRRPAWTAAPAARRAISQDSGDVKVSGSSMHAVPAVACSAAR